MAVPANINLSTLDGVNGFKLSGGSNSRGAGTSVAAAGDVNGDGFADMIVGVPGTSSVEGLGNTGAAYVVYGAASGFAADINLTTLNGAGGFKLTGVAVDDRTGMSVASAGDINGDGYDDLIIGAPSSGANNSPGSAYIVFGKAPGFAANTDLSTLDGSDGFKLSGAASRDFAGFSVASAGDVNGDGFDDLIVGAHGADPHGIYSGASYVIFGKEASFAANIDLATLNGGDGFKLSGAAANDDSGYSVASAGDINGDGYDDVIIGAALDGSGSTFPGAGYVVFGKASGFAANIDLSTLNGANGFKLSAVTTYSQGLWSVASAGDVNGDGFDDLIVGSSSYYAPLADADPFPKGRSYVVFGKESGFTANLDVSTLDGTTGFRLTGAADYDYFGSSVASAGDFNGDGYDDLIVGATHADAPTHSSGATYVVFGKASGFAPNLNVGSLDGTDGFKLSGVAAFDYSGSSVASAGDVNGDGFDDLIIGAPMFSGNGMSYVVFGGAFGASDTPVTTIGTAAAEILIGGIGDDVLTGGGGTDVFHAGAGDDRLVVADLAFHLADGGNGTDMLALAGAGLTLDLTDTLTAAKLESIERIDLTGTGNNSLKVGKLAVLSGVGAVTGGNHILTIEGDSGDSVLLNDEAWVNAGAVGLFDRWVLGGAELRIEQGVSVSGIAVPGVTIEGTAGDDEIGPGKTVAGQPHVTSRDDILNGYDGNDSLNGGAGADVMDGGSGDDMYYVDNIGDQVIDSSGTDTVRSSIDYTLTGEVAIEILRVIGTSGLTLTGNELANALVGGAGDDHLNGGDGSDVLAGRAGADVMNGGGGNDVYYIDDPADYVGETIGGGTDTVCTTVSYALAVGQEVENLRVVSGVSSDLTLTGNEFANKLYGGAGSDHLNGGGGNDVLDGRAGADTMAGGDQNDIYYVDDVGDVIAETVGYPGGTDTVRASVSYTLAANVENMILTGTGDIDGFGNELGNVLTGNVGDNLLDGGAGADTLRGGEGNDIFRFSSSLGGGSFADIVGDFDHASDTIQLDDAIFASLSLGALAAGAFNTGSTATEVDDRILYDAARKSLYYDADGVGGVAAVKFATISVTGTLDHTDFFVV